MERMFGLLGLLLLLAVTDDASEVDWHRHLPNTEDNGALLYISMHTTADFS